MWVANECASMKLTVLLNKFFILNLSPFLIIYIYKYQNDNSGHFHHHQKVPLNIYFDTTDINLVHDEKLIGRD